jgi:DNA-directed RNA polymerase subunit RPC12/RpoP
MANADSAEIPETLAAVRCIECGRQRTDDERWRIYLADTGEVAIYCPECAGREFGD